MEPKFKHDCSRCMYLGTFLGYDVYHCSSGKIPTMVARYGNTGHDNQTYDLEIIQSTLDNMTSDESVEREFNNIATAQIAAMFGLAYEFVKQLRHDNKEVNAKVKVTGCIDEDKLIDNIRTTMIKFGVIGGPLRDLASISALIHHLRDLTKVLTPLNKIELSFMCRFDGQRDTRLMKTHHTGVVDLHSQLAIWETDKSTPTLVEIVGVETVRGDRVTWIVREVDYAPKMTGESDVPYFVSCDPAHVSNVQKWLQARMPTILMKYKDIVNKNGFPSHIVHAKPAQAHSSGVRISISNQMEINSLSVAIDEMRGELAPDPKWKLQLPGWRPVLT